MAMTWWTDRVELHGVAYTRHTFAWESDADGKADLICDGIHGPFLRGQLDYIVTAPDPATPPTDNYDITLEDERGHDVLDGAGLNRDTATVERAYVKDVVGNVRVMSLSTLGPLWLRVTNAGAGKAGQIAFHVLACQNHPPA
jgi:hypothetical protein